MKEFIKILRRFVPPYKKYLVLTIIFNILSAILNIFSFAAIIPILNILFKTEESLRQVDFIPWTQGDLKETLSNNMNYYVQELIIDMGATTTLLLIGLFLAFATFLKTGAYFLSSASIIPIRTGVVRDIRNQLYQKITALPLGFFSEERKGDIIARMSGDVQEIESSIMSSLDMLFKNPILSIAANAVHHRLRAADGMAHGLYRQKTEAELREGTVVVERHDECCRGNPRRTAHHQGIQRGG